jgi:hypothetical protein
MRDGAEHPGSLLLLFKAAKGHEPGTGGGESGSSSPSYLGIGPSICLSTSAIRLPLSLSPLSPMAATIAGGQTDRNTMKNIVSKPIASNQVFHFVNLPGSDMNTSFPPSTVDRSSHDRGFYISMMLVFSILSFPGYF